MKKTKRIALIIAVLMLMAVCFAFGVSALDAEGQCGENVYWNYNDGTGELVIYGEGEMYNYDSNFNESPFDSSDIKSIVIEDGVTTIGDCAFYECADLSNQTNLNNIISIGEMAFAHCNNITNVVIPEGVNEIKAGAFYCCIKLEEATIPASVTSLGEFVFSECFSLKKITVDSNNSAYSSDNRGILFNKDKTVLIQYPSGNENATYTIPESVNTIERLAFFSALHLEEITIPENVETIGFAAFQQCFNVTSITISNGVKAIGETAFFGFPFLEKIIIKDMDTEFGYYCFETIYEVPDISKEDFIDLVVKYFSGEVTLEEMQSYMIFSDEMFNIGTIYCHSGSTAETYAIENGVDYELTHFYEGEWNYDYENNIRTRKCIHCDELQVEELEIEELTGDNFLLVEEKVTNGIDGEVEVLKAFDINLKNCDGVHVQPDGTIKVKLPNDWSKNGTYKVYRVNDDGTLTDMNAYREGSHLVFDTDHFSIYVIVFESTTEEEPETPDTPAEPDTTECDCICHETGFLNRILAIVYRILMKLFGIAPVCECGVAHY